MKCQAHKPRYMMYQKAILFKDSAIAAKILKTTSPKEQKALGRQVSNFDNDIWFENRERIVRDGRLVNLLCLVFSFKSFCSFHGIHG